MKYIKSTIECMLFFGVGRLIGLSFSGKFPAELNIFFLNFCTFNLCIYINTTKGELKNYGK